MSIAAFELVLPVNDEADGDSQGVALVDSVTGLCLPLSVNAFADVDEADAFLEWMDARRINPRELDAEELRAKHNEWQQPRDHAA